MSAESVADFNRTLAELDTMANEPYSTATDVTIGMLSEDELRWYLRVAVIAMSMHDPVTDAGSPG